MHTDEPYTVLAPRPCRVATPTGFEDGLLIGRCGAHELVVHGVGGYDKVTWTPSDLAWVVDWAPWSAGLAANA